MRQLRRSMIARAAIGCWREPMQSWKRVAPIAVPFLIIIAVTDVGYFFKDVAHARHLVFFYLLPTAFVAMLYGSVLSMIFAIDATFVSDLFLYDPTYGLGIVRRTRGAPLAEKPTDDVSIPKWLLLLGSVLAAG